MKYFFKEKYRISAINLFQKGIRPEWEDDRNKNGYTLMLEYIVKDNIEQFYTLVTEKWVKLMCFLIGETIPYSNNINGIRFVDKTKFGYNKSIVFRFEIWVDSSIKENEVDELKKKLSTEFGCMATVKSNKK